MHAISTPDAEAARDTAVSPKRDLIAYIAATTTGRSQQRLAFVDSLKRPGGATSPPSEAASGGGSETVCWRGHPTANDWLLCVPAQNAIKTRVQDS